MLSIDQNLTLIIPTHFRHKYLKRALAYYSLLPYRILVSDSSDVAYGEGNLPENVKYTHCSGKSFIDKLADVVSKVETPYVLLCADDDFITENGIAACLEFLKKNPDFSSAQGHYIGFLPRQDIITYPIYTWLPGYEIGSDNIKDRFSSIAGKYMHQFYSVSRTKPVKYFFNNLSDSNANANLMEVAHALVLLAEGKHKVLPIYYCAREVAPISGGNTIKRLSAVLESPEEMIAFSKVVNVLVDYISDYDGLDKKEAVQLVDRVLRSIATSQKASSGSSGRIKWAVRNLMTKVFGEKLVNDIRVFRKNILEPRWYIKYKAKRKIDKVRGIPGYPYSDSEAKKYWEDAKKFIINFTVQN